MKVLGNKALNNRIDKIKELELQKKALEEQINSLKDEIREDMTNRKVSEYDTGNFIIRFKEVFTNSFDSKLFKEDHPDMYLKYLVEKSSMRLTLN